MAELGARDAHTNSEEDTGSEEKGEGEADKRTMDVDAQGAGLLAEGQQRKERKRMRPTVDNSCVPGATLTLGQMRAKLVARSKLGFWTNNRRRLPQSSRRATQPMRRRSRQKSWQPTQPSLS